MDKIQLNEFYQNLYQETFLSFDIDPDSSKSDIFRRMIGEYLEEDGVLSDVVWAEYYQKDMELSGYSFDSERGLLTIIGDHFFQTDTIETLTKDLYERDFKKLKRFYSESVNEETPLYKDMAPGDPASGISKFLLNYNKEGKIKRITYLLLTNGILTRNTKMIPSEIINGIKSDFQVYDITNVYQIVMEQQSLQVIVNLEELGAKEGLPCIKAINDTNENYESYLVVMPGVILAKIYDQYGQKLLEQNVRTFLQLKGKTNKYMLATIKSQPDRFFIYNNGLTCTASNVVTTEKTDYLRILSLESLQIVNGGQTSSVIYKAYTEGVDLSKVYVQMKLSVIHDTDSYDDIVGSIARYANTQNPVKDADFFSNTPFNKGFYEVSRNCWTPLVGGRQYKTLWFYERTRGLYLNEKSKYTREGREKEFLKKYPKEQLIDKITLAKTAMIFSGRPHSSVKSNVAFAQFSADISKLIEDKKDFAVTPQSFMETIGQIITVNETDKLIMAKPWAKGMRSIRAHIKAYSLALLDKNVKKIKRHLNFQDVWDRQSLSPEFERAIEICIDAVHSKIIKYPDITDIRERLGRAYTWEEFEDTNIPIQESLLKAISISEQQKASNDNENKVNSKIMSQANKMEVILKLTITDWNNLYKFFEDNKGLYSGVGLGAQSLLARMSRKQFYPTRKNDVDALYKLVLLGSQNGIIKST